MAVNESFTVGGVEINDGVTFELEALDVPPPPKRPDWVQGADADGAVLNRDPLVDNRVVTARIRVVTQASMDLALAKIGQIIDKVEEAEHQPDGLACVWTPANSTKSFTLYALSGDFDGVPITHSGDDAGWFQRTPVITVRLTCKPYGYGSATTLSASSGSTPMLTLTAASIPGDVPAEARLVVTDTATQSRRFLEWGLEQRYYNAATSLLLDSDSLSVSGFAGVQSTGSNAYDPNASGNNAVRVDVQIANRVVAVCGTGAQAHVGTFRVKARIQANVNMRCRFTWKVGNGPLRANDWVSGPLSDRWVEIDLGLISIPTVLTGTQAWTGQIEMMSTVSAVYTGFVDYLLLIPAGEGYGKARATYTDSGSVIAAYDSFLSTTVGDALNGRVAPSGGTWATSGSATDLAFSDAPAPSETAARSTASDSGRRYAILGATSYIASRVSVSVRHTAREIVNSGVIARWVDSSNFAWAELDGLAPGYVEIGVNVAGVRTTLASTPYAFSANAWYTLVLLCYASGRIRGWLTNANGTTLVSVESAHSAIATGGALATGKPGFYDFNAFGAAPTRYYDDFSYAVPPTEPVVINSGRAAEIRHDGAIAQDSTGASTGEVPYRGSRFLLPAAGDAGRTSRIAVLARRNDTETADAENVTDALQAQVTYTPRYLAIPR